MITPDEVLRTCHTEGRAGTFSISEQAHERARSQGHSPGDLRHALGRATRCALQDGRWLVAGPSLDGTEISMAVVIAGGSLSVI